MMKPQKEYITSVGSVLAAFLASSHHWLHMLIMALGIGSGAMSGWMALPAVRHAMVIMSLSMVAYMQVTYWRRKHRPLRMTVMVMGSSVMSLVMTLYTLMAAGGGGHHF